VNAETIRTRLGTKQRWEKRADGWWLEDSVLDVENMARLMIEAGARLITITARPVEGSTHQLVYHWDMEGYLVNFITVTRDGAMPSIATICPAANWIEREVHDYFAVNFTGREDLAPLLLRPDDPPGMFHWNSKEGGKQ